MPARKRTKSTDALPKLGKIARIGGWSPEFGIASQLAGIVEAPDGEAPRTYDNRGSGLSEESGENYNEAHGRAADAPTKGFGHQGR